LFVDRAAQSFSQGALRFVERSHRHRYIDPAQLSAEPPHDMVRPRVAIVRLMHSVRHKTPVVIVRVSGQGDGKLSLMLRAPCRPCRSPRLAKRGQHHRDQHRKDRHHDQQFDDREPCMAMTGSATLRRRTGDRLEPSID